MFLTRCGRSRSEGGETATRARGTIGAVLRFAIATGRAERDPTADLRGALITPTVTHRATIVEPEAVGALLRAIDGFEGRGSTVVCSSFSPCHNWDEAQPLCDWWGPQCFAKMRQAVGRRFNRECSPCPRNGWLCSLGLWSCEPHSLQDNSDVRFSGKDRSLRPGTK
jgi:hypothetical protein